MISMIAAVGENLEIGKNNALIWHLSKDLKYFQEITLNHKVIMGYNTYLSIGHPLKNRDNIVIVDDKHKIKDKNIKVYDNIDELIKKEINNKEECFIIGGASMYKYFYTLCDRMYLTLIKASDKEADTYFPDYRKDNWQKKIIREDNEKGINFAFCLFERIEK